MKFLAIEKGIESAKWINEEALLKEEAAIVHKLYLDGCIREIYFDENHCAVIILEAENKTKASEILGSLTLVKNKLIKFDLSELKPYTGLLRLMND